jgi:hypothetical protein
LQFLSNAVSQHQPLQWLSIEMDRVAIEMVRRGLVCI